MKRSRLRRCFISASLKTDTAFLRRAMEDRGIEWSDAASLPPGTSILSGIESAVERADFVCVVFTEDGRSESSAFELGLALGHAKPVLVFAAPGISLSPIVDSLITGVSRLDDREAIGSQLDIFLESAVTPSLPARKSKGKLVRRVSRPAALGSIEGLLAKDAASQARLFCDWTAELFQSAGVVVSQYRQGPESTRAHLAVWISELQSVFGNPILVECKIGNLSESDLHETEVHLRHEVARIKKLGGLLIYLDRGRREFPQREFDLPLVLRLSAKDLADFVEAGTLAAKLATIRNRLVHGQGVEG